ncbi:hypothetical protein C0J52_18363 [Blattella germanica]|nr:hypothetical protein C0J52_18363 [Blattella germanica]
MKQKQEKERKVTAHSTIAAVSGPRPDVKVKKHFENAWREKNKTDRPTLSKPIDSLPCICEEQEEEPVVPQKPKFKAKPQDDRKKCYRPKLQSSFQKPKLSGPNQKSNKSTGERLSKRSVEINVMLPAVTTDADNSSSSSAVEKKTNTPVNSPSEIQLDMQNKIINDTLSELEHLYSTKQTNQSEVDMLYSDKPCYPNHSVIAEGDYNPITWTPSMNLIIHTPYHFAGGGGGGGGGSVSSDGGDDDDDDDDG